MTQAATMTPDPPQRLRALERANEIRLARAELKRRIAQGEVSVAEVILDSPVEAESWSVSELLMAQRRWGSERCRKFLRRNDIYELKPVGKLTHRQRVLLATQLEAFPCRERLEASPGSERLEASTRSMRLEVREEQLEASRCLEREAELVAVA
jgi:hypothetical protein